MTKILRRNRRSRNRRVENVNRKHPTKLNNCYNKLRTFSLKL